MPAGYTTQEKGWLLPRQHQATLPFHKHESKVQGSEVKNNFVWCEPSKRLRHLAEAEAGPFGPSLVTEGGSCPCS